jgi:hypothetical protein
MDRQKVTKVSEDFISGLVNSVAYAVDRAVWRKACYFKMLHWMRDNEFEGDKNERRRTTILLLKRIVGGVTSAKSLNHEQKRIFAHDIKALWFKVSNQVKMERGSTFDQDMAGMDNNRRQDEGISD